MFLNLAHKSLHVYAATRELVKAVYTITKLLPTEEKFNMVLQMRRAALSVKLNLAEGASRRSGAERNRFIEMPEALLWKLTQHWKPHAIWATLGKNNFVLQAKA